MRDMFTLEGPSALARAVLVVCALGLLVAAAIAPSRATGNLPGDAPIFALRSDAPEVIIIDPDAKAERARFPLPDIGTHLALSSDGARLAVSEAGSDTIWIMDAASGALLHTLSLDIAPWLIAFSPEQPLLAVGDTDLGAVVLYDVTTGQQTARVDGVPGVHDLRFDAAGARLLLASLDTNIVVEMDVETGSVAQNHDLPGPAGGFDHAVRSIDGRLAIAVEPVHEGQSIVAFTPGDLSRDATAIAMPEPIRRAYADPFGERFYLPSSWSGTVHVLDRSDRALIGTFDGGGPESLLTFGFLGTSVITASIDTGTLTAHDAHSLEPIRTIATGMIPAALMGDDQSGRITLIGEEGAIRFFDTIPVRGQPVFRPAGGFELDGVRIHAATAAGALGFCHS